MNKQPLGPGVTVVAIDDDPATLDLVKAALKQQPLEILTASDPEAGLELVLRERPQIVLLDLMMPKLSGMDLLERIVDAAPDTDVVLLTGHYSTDSAVEAIRKGACDYLTKPISIADLRQRMSRFIGEARRKQAAQELDNELLRAHQFEGMVGRSPLMLAVFTRIRRVAPHFRTALVTGATGTGKELVAEALHKLSPVSKGRFAVVNCSAVVETLFESELFGHVRGAFTGASHDKVGLFEYANGGTVMLDEIGDMPLALQAKLLRVIERRAVVPLGGTTEVPIDIRLVAATNRDLESMVLNGTFRRDLYYRLSGITFHIPALRDRKEDIALLLHHFMTERGLLDDGARLPVELVHQFVEYDWPGNVRELVNKVKRLEILAQMVAEGDLVELARSVFAQEKLSGAKGTGSLFNRVVEFERMLILEALLAAHGNKCEAARLLGVHEATVRTKLKRYGITLPSGAPN